MNGWDQESVARQLAKTIVWAPRFAQQEPEPQPLSPPVQLPKGRFYEVPPDITLHDFLEAPVTGSPPLSLLGFLQWAKGMAEKAVGIQPFNPEQSELWWQAKRAGREAAEKFWQRRLEEHMKKLEAFGQGRPYVAPAFATGKAEVEELANEPTSVGTVLERAPRQIANLLSGVGTLALTAGKAILGGVGTAKRARTELANLIYGLPEGIAESAGRIAGYFEHPSAILKDPVTASLDISMFTPFAPAEGISGKVAKALSATRAAKLAKPVEYLLAPADMLMPTKKNIIGLPLRGAMAGAKWLVRGEGPLSGLRQKIFGPPSFWKSRAELEKELGVKLAGVKQVVEEKIAEASRGFGPDDWQKAFEMYRNVHGGRHTIMLVDADGNPVLDHQLYLNFGPRGGLDADEVLKVTEEIEAAFEKARQSGSPEPRIVVRTTLHGDDTPAKILAERLSAIDLETKLGLVAKLGLEPEATAQALKYSFHERLFTPQQYSKALDIGISGGWSTELAEKAFTAKRAAGWQERLEQGRYLALPVLENLRAQMYLFSAGAQAIDELLKATKEAMQKAAQESPPVKTRPINLSLVDETIHPILVEALGKAPPEPAVIRLEDLPAKTRALVEGIWKVGQERKFLQQRLEALGNIRTDLSLMRETLSNRLMPILDKMREMSDTLLVDNTVATVFNRALDGVKSALPAIEALEAIAKNLAEAAPLVTHPEGLRALSDRFLADAAEAVRRAYEAGKTIDAAEGVLRQAASQIFKGSDVAKTVEQEVAALKQATAKLADDVRAFGLDEIREVLKSGRPRIKVPPEIPAEEIPFGYRRIIRRALYRKVAERTALEVPEPLADWVEHTFAKNQQIGWKRWFGNRFGGVLDQMHNQFVNTVLFLSFRVPLLNQISAALYLVPIVSREFKLPNLLVEFPKTFLEYWRPIKAKVERFKEVAGDEAAAQKAIAEMGQDVSESSPILTLSADPEAMIDLGGGRTIKRKDLWERLEIRQSLTGIAGGEQLTPFESAPVVGKILRSVYGSGRAFYATGPFSDAVQKEAFVRAAMKAGRAATVDEAVEMANRAFGSASNLPPGVMHLSRTILPFFGWSYFATPKLSKFLGEYAYLAAYYKALANALEKERAFIDEIDIERLRRQYPNWFQALTYLGFRRHGKPGPVWIDMSRGGLRTLPFDVAMAVANEPSGELFERFLRALGTQTWWGVVPLGIALSALQGQAINVKTGQELWQPGDPTWWKLFQTFYGILQPFVMPGEWYRMTSELIRRSAPELIGREIPARRGADFDLTDLVTGLVIGTPATYRPSDLFKRALNVAKMKMTKTDILERKVKALQDLWRLYESHGGVRR